MTSALGRHAGFVCDLDGVVYRGPAAIPHAVESLAQLAPVVFATNNASRSPEAVSAHLTDLGVHTSVVRIVNSSQTAAWLLRDLVPPGSTVLCIGGPGVRVAVEDAGYRVVCSASDEDAAPAAVVQGYGPDVRARDLAEGTYAVVAGALWVATNADATFPTDRGFAPGNGALVSAMECALGRAPDVIAGKPGPAIYALCGDRLTIPAGELLAIGDRLDTDIAGANAAGMESVIVLTGVASLRSVVAAEPALRPTWVAADLRALVNTDAAAVARELTDLVRRAWDRGTDGPDPDVEDLIVRAEELHARYLAG